MRSSSPKCITATTSASKSNLNVNAAPYVPKSLASKQTTSQVHNTTIDDSKTSHQKADYELDLGGSDHLHKVIEEDSSGEDEDDCLVVNAEYCKECKSCTCCKGFIYICNGAVCKDLGMCHCKSAMDTFARYGSEVIKKCT